MIWLICVCLFSYFVLWHFSAIPFVFLVPPAAFLFSVVNLHQMLLMGQQKVKARNINLLVMPALIIPVFLLFFFKTDSARTAYPIALFIALVVSAVVSRLQLGRVLAFKGETFRFETEILKQGFWVQCAQAIQFLNYRLNFFLIAFFIGNAALGIYNNAVILCESVWILGHSIGQIQHMKILNTTNETEHILLTRNLIRINFVGSVLLCLLLYSIPNAFWMALFSKDFASMNSLFIYLFPGVLCFSISNIIAHLMHAKGMFKQLLICNGFGLASGLIFSLLLIPGYGLTGACLSWSAGLAASMFYHLFQFKIISVNISKNN